MPSDHRQQTNGREIHRGLSHQASQIKIDRRCYVLVQGTGFRCNEHHLGASPPAWGVGL
jgi:hypothetical protein